MTLQHAADHRGRHGAEHRAGQQGERSQHRAGGEDRDRHDEQGLRGDLRTMNGELGIDTGSNSR